MSMIKFGDLNPGETFYRVHPGLGRIEKLLKMIVADENEKRPMNAVSLADGFQFHMPDDMWVESTR